MKRYIYLSPVVPLAPIADRHLPLQLGQALASLGQAGLVHLLFLEAAAGTAAQQSTLSGFVRDRGAGQFVNFDGGFVRGSAADRGPGADANDRQVLAYHGAAAGTQVRAFAATAVSRQRFIAQGKAVAVDD